MTYSNALQTDLYELTMAYGYWTSGKDRDQAVFHLYFRENPFEGGYTIVAGLEQAVQYLQSLRFSRDDEHLIRHGDVDRVRLIQRRHASRTPPLQCPP